MKKMIIIGAGPIGTEAALYAAELGFEVRIFDRAGIGANIRRWGHVRLFSPWHMNHSELGITALQAANHSWQAPQPTQYMTGSEYVDKYLIPLSEIPKLAGKFQTGKTVLHVARDGILKNDLIADSGRSNYPFRVHTIDSSETEEVFHADIVIDASGVYNSPNWLGDGGVPAIGEQSNKHRINYHIPDIHEGEYIGTRTLVVGSGYSAATVVRDLTTVINDHPGTSLLWCIRQDRELPIPEITDDPLPGRAQLTRIANNIVCTETPGVEFRNNTTVESVSFEPASEQFTVGLRTKTEIRYEQVNKIIAMVGYGPDNTIYRELQVHECYASRGPMTLSAALLGTDSSDCLVQDSAGPDTLKNPEPDFYIIGNKSYGRNPSFLIRTGLQQIVEVFNLVMNDPGLNLYNNIARGG